MWRPRHRIGQCRAELARSCPTTPLLLGQSCLHRWDARQAEPHRSIELRERCWQRYRRSWWVFSNLHKAGSQFASWANFARTTDWQRGAAVASNSAEVAALCSTTNRNRNDANCFSNINYRCRGSHAHSRTDIRSTGLPNAWPYLGNHLRAGAREQSQPEWGAVLVGDRSRCAPLVPTGMLVLERGITSRAIELRLDSPMARNRPRGYTTWSLK